MQVTIRLLREEDAYTSVIWRNDPEVFKYTGNTYDHEILIDSELSWIRKVIEKNESGKEYRCAILADDIYVGNIYLTDINGASAHYHIFIGDKEYWGKGVAKQASLLILKYAFEKLQLKSVSLKVRKDNISAFNLYKNLGFKEIENKDGWTTMQVNNI